MPLAEKVDVCTLSPMALKSITPILNTSDLAALLTFLQEKVGFQFLWDVKADGTGEAMYAGVSYEGSEVHVNQAESTPKEMTIYLQVEDVDELYAQLKEKGAEPTEPEDQFYGMRDISITGPEGTLIGFGSEIAS
ncbi:hypothetical protein EON79_15320 [bacterium]|nr:MAG: hypothetical protein EON79_15320 [bacterium]